MSGVAVFLWLIGAYVAVGIATAVAFVAFGLARVMPHTRVTAGARILFIPGAAALWPLILSRWLAPR